MGQLSNTISIVSGASSMGDKAFMPNPLVIKVGDSVTWQNTDVETHTVTSTSTEDNRQEDDKFDSGLIHPGLSFEHRFGNAGHYRYSCLIHPSMNGEIIVNQT